MEQIKDLVFEMQHLKNIKHEGWKFGGVENPNSVAEHSLCAAQIGYILAKLEGADPFKVVTILTWHDMGETRIGDITKIGARYIPNKSEIENNAVTDQLKNIKFGKDILNLLEEYNNGSTKEGIIAKEADKLEIAFQGIIYHQIGYKDSIDITNRVGEGLKTRSGKSMWKAMKNGKFTDRWKNNDLKIKS